MLNLLLLFSLLSEVPEDVIEDEVAIGLLSKDKGLDESLVRLAFVGDLANDLDDDVRVGALRIDVGDPDLGVLEVELFDSVVDRLSGPCQQQSNCCLIDGVPSDRRKH